MRNKIFYLLITLFFIGCYEDKGNYDYIDVNDVKINNIPALIECYVGEELEIIPEFEYKFKDLSSKYQYKWYKLNEVISEEKNLYFEKVNLPIGSHICYLEVTETETGIVFIQKFTLNIKSPFQQGWMILSEQEGKSKLSILSSKIEIVEEEGKEPKAEEVFYEYPFIYKKLNKQDLGVEPYKLAEHWAYSKSSIGEVCVIQKDLASSVELNGVSLKKEVNVSDEFLNTEIVNNKIKDIVYTTFFSYILMESGDVYCRANSDKKNFHTGKYDSSPMCNEKGEPFKADMMYLANPFKNSGLFFFDGIKRRFLGMSLYKYDAKRDAKLFTFEDEEEPKLDDMQMDIVSMGYSAYNDSYGWGNPYDQCLLSILKSEDGDYYLHRLKTVVDWSRNISVVKNYSLQEFAEGTNIITSQSKYCYFKDESVFHFLISSGSKLYAVNINDAQTNEVISFNSEITAMANCYTASGVHQLIIGFKDGSYKLFEVKTFPSIELKEIYSSKDNVGEIKDIIFKYGATSEVW